MRWTVVPDPPRGAPPRAGRCEGAPRFKRGEGIWPDRGTVYVATTGDARVHAYDIRRERMRVIYDGLATRAAPLLRVDQLTANRVGEVFVCEDLSTDEIDIGVIDRSLRVSRFLSATGPEHENSELTGVAFDPSEPDVFLVAARGRIEWNGGSGTIYEISGPFHGRRLSRGVHAPDQSA